MNTKLMVAIAILLLVAPFSYAGGNKDKNNQPQIQQSNDTPSPQTSSTTSAPSANPYFNGDGGKGKSITILPPRGVGLAANQAYLPDFVANELVSNFKDFSAMTLFDRVNNQKQYDELLSGYYADDDKAGLDLGHLTSTDYMLLGNITRTSTGYALQLTVNSNNDKTTAAAYSGTVSIAELDNLTGVRRASLDLLQKMGVQISEQTKTELTNAAAASHVNAQTAMAQGIAAQRQGTEVEALSYFFQAAAFDPTLTEATSRSSILAANISSGNIGEDVRNDIQWRRNWIARLAETEQYFNNYFDNFFKTASSPYTLFYTTEIKQGPTNYDNETTILSIETNLHASSEWLESAERVLQSMQSSIKAVQDGLTATGKAVVWGLDKWPGQSGFNLKPFGKQNKNFTVIFELVNSKNQVIGRQTLQASGSYEIRAPVLERYTMISVSADDRKTITFTNVKADDITDNLTIRIASVNGANAETAARNGVLQISPLSADEWNSFHNPVYSVTNNYPQPPRQQTPSSPPQSSPEIPQTNRPSKPSRLSFLNQAYFPFTLWGGFNYSLYVGPGFTFGIMNLYTSWSFNGLFFDDRVNAFEWTVGWSIPVVNKYLMIPIGLGGNTITKERDHKFVLETGLQLCLGFVYLTGTYRLTGWNRHGFTIGAGYGDLEW